MTVNKTIEPLIPILFMGILLLLGLTHIDDRFAQLFFDSSNNSFPARRSFLFKIVLHDWARQVVFLTAAITLGVFLLTFIRSDLRRFRKSLFFILVSMVITTSIIAIIKHMSSIHCPYHLVEWGGSYQRVELLDWSGIDQKPGRCWPSGHASAGFCLLAYYFAARELKSTWTAPVLIAVLAIGFTFTVSQAIRGAHFISHGLWTALIIWELNILLARIMLRRQQEEDLSGL